LVLLLTMASCAHSKYLADGEVLHNKTNVKLISKENIKKQADLQRDLEQQPIPKLNKKSFNLVKSKLWFHYYLKDAESPIDKWLFETFTEPPVLYDSLMIERSVKRLENRLVSKGYFNHDVSHEVSIEDGE